MKYAKKPLFKTLASPAAIYIIIGLLIIIVNLFLLQRSWSYTSDDVSWQTTLLTWHPFSGSIAYVGSKDNFLINLPFYVVLGHIFHGQRVALFAEATCFAFINYCLFFWVTLRLMRKFSIKLSYSSLLPILWLASLGNNLIDLYLNTNWRDYEIGITFIFYLIALMYYLDEIKPFKNWLSKFSSLILLAGASLVTYSDPYFFDLTLLPVFMLFIVLYLTKKVSSSKLLNVTIFLLSDLAISRLITTVVARVGIISPRNSVQLLTAPAHLLSSLKLAVKGTLQLFGIIFGSGKSAGLEDISSIFGALLLAIGIFVIIQSITDKKLLVNNDLLNYKIVRAFFSALSIFVVLAYIFSDNGAIGSYRYLVILVYTICILLIFWADKLKPRDHRLFISLMCLAILFNCLNFIYQDKIATGANASNYRLIAKLEANRLTKGYGGYWDGDINTYLSKGRVNILPVACVQQRSKPLKLLVNGSLFKQSVAKSFYVVDSHYKSPGACSQQQVVDQFGLPQKTIKLNDQTIMIYSYDLINKM